MINRFEQPRIRPVATLVVAAVTVVVFGVFGCSQRASNGWAQTAPPLRPKVVLFEQEQGVVALGAASDSDSTDR